MLVDKTKPDGRNCDRSRRMEVEGRKSVDGNLCLTMDVNGCRLDALATTLQFAPL